MPAKRSPPPASPAAALEVIDHHRRVEMLHRAVEGNRPDGVRLMAELGFPLGDTTWHDGVGINLAATPMHNAAWMGNLEMVKLLIALGAPTRARDPQYGGTPPGWAATNRQPRVVEHLLPSADIFDAVYCGGVQRAAELLRADPSLAGAVDDHGHPLVFHLHPGRSSAPRPCGGGPMHAHDPRPAPGDIVRSHGCDIRKTWWHGLLGAMGAIPDAIETYEAFKEKESPAATLAARAMKELWGAFILKDSAGLDRVLDRWLAFNPAAAPAANPPSAQATAACLAHVDDNPRLSAQRRFCLSKTGVSRENPRQPPYDWSDNRPKYAACGGTHFGGCMSRDLRQPRKAPLGCSAPPRAAPPRPQGAGH